jgi:hypothetical protein
MASAYTVEDADPVACAEQIQALWVQNLAGHSAESARAKLALGYVDNPAGPGAVLLLRADGEPPAVGVQGLHPRTFHHGERRVRAAGLADFAVDAGHRSLGPALMLMRSGVQRAGERFDMTYGLPNAKAAPVCQRAGLKRIGAMRRHAKPLRSRAQLAQRLPAGLAGVLAPLADLALRAADLVRAVRQPSRLRFREARWDDPAIDALWARRDPQRLWSERSATLLRWRFGEPARGDWRIGIATDRDGQPQGHVTWRLIDGFAEVGDFFAPDPGRTTLPLLSAFTRAARRAGAASISLGFFGSPQVERQLAQAGFRVRPQTAPVFVAPGGAAPESPDSWHLTAFDNDAD